MNDRILLAVDQLRPSALQLLQELVRIPSVTGQEASVQNYLAEYLRRLDLEVDVWCPNLSDLDSHSSYCPDGLPLGERPVVVARLAGTQPSAPSLILNGHADVVPPGEETAWTDGPWSGALRGGHVWGRGSCDMKGGLVAGILAISAIRQAGVRLRGNVFFQSVIGEETGGAGTLAAVLRGFRADAAIVLEPTGLEICPTGAGALSFRLQVPGRAAHGAMRREGVSAVEKFCVLLAAINQLEEERHAHFQHPLFERGALAAPISIGRIMAGDWISTVPESLIAEGRYGVLPGEKIQDARNAFEAAVRKAADADAWLAANHPTVEWIEGQFAPAETPVNAPILTALRSAHTYVHRTAPVLRGVPYGSDLRFFTNEARIDAVLYGPGDVRLAHSVNERVPVSQVVAVAKVIALTLIRWCGV